MTKGLQLTNLQVSIDEKQILNGVSLTLKPGELHAIMGPNGSGKSTLAYALAGHPSYTILSGSKVTLDGEDIIELSPDERAQKGLFLAFQYPVEVPGVSVQNFLRQAYQARFASEPNRQFKTVLAFRNHLKAIAQELKIDETFLRRGLNEGFSGGEKKQLEILQLAVLEPKYVILDETDSGLDIDAIKKVAKAVAVLQKKFSLGVLVITHYQRILQYLKPDVVHVLVAGKIKQSGGPELVEKLEKSGYTTLKD
ncbi:MAG: Fe-S cluster assembly ATPase SufC [bacterium]|nr:Fe-S cluster assembly ATPase SufC [bacterium]